MNISTRQPARRPLGPAKTFLNPNVDCGIGRNDSVGNTGKFSAAFTGFVEIIFLSFNQSRLGLRPRSGRNISLFR
jgi:hypothetical protein